MNLKDKNVLVVGLGKSGISAALFLYQQGANVTANDHRKEVQLSNAMLTLHGLPIQLYLGEHPEQIFESSDLIVLSPGVPKAIAPIQQAVSKGIPVISEVELASWFLKDKIIAITGSNGKTTTTALTAHLLKRSGLNAISCGNIGTPLTELIPDTDENRILVVELSSFQLETIERFKPFIATVLNVTADHMDRYSGFDDYKSAKLRIFNEQDKDEFAVINADEMHADEIMNSVSARKVLFSAKRTLESGMFLDGDEIIWDYSGEKIPLLRKSELSLPGPHNLENSLAAATMALLAGGDQRGVALGLKDFQPLEHRLETVAEIDGVQFVNDSKATNVDSTAVALQSFDAPVIVLLGGRDKDSDFTVLNPLLKKHVKHVVLLGEAAGKIRDSLDPEVKHVICSSFEEAVKASHKIAGKGEVVLLSPGCASFDMFDSFEHRGRDFKRIVMELKNAER